VQPVLDAMYGQTIDGQKVSGNAYQILSDYLSLSYPYRLGKDLRFGTARQSPESIPFLHERAAQATTKAAQQYAQAKAQATGPIGQKILAGALGVYPKPDTTAVVAAAINAKQAAHQRSLAKKAKKASGADPFATSSASSGPDPFATGKSSATANDPFAQ
jgi:uncharacterized protein YdbL (DUF1318 family)